MSTGKRQLVEIIKALRSDIEAAVVEGEGQKVKFDVNEIEIDLQTQITKGGEVGASGEVEFKVLGFELGKASAEAKGNYNKQDSHTIKLKLRPKRWNVKTQAYEELEFSDID